MNAAAERIHSRQVNLQQGLEISRFDLIDGATIPHANIVDQDVQSAMNTLDFRQRGIHHCLISHVEDQRLSHATHRSDLFNRLRHLSTAPAIHQNGSTSHSQGLGYFETEPSTTSGHQSHFAG
jgi:hypothetical protein